MTITEFLEARIAEDEAHARAVVATVAPDAWENPTKWGNFYPEDIAFYDSQTPYRVLDECAVKRAIIMAYEACIHAAPTLRNPGMVAAFEIVLECHAAVYKEHPDYRPEWSL